MKTIKTNEGKIDRVTRVVVGVILIAVGAGLGNQLGWILGIIGLIPLLTGLIGWCPLYALFKINTCKLLHH